MKKILLTLALLTSFNAIAQTETSSGSGYVGFAFYWSDKTFNYASRVDNSREQLLSRLHQVYGSYGSVIASQRGQYCALARQGEIYRGEQGPFGDGAACSDSQENAKDLALRLCNRRATPGNYCVLVPVISSY